LNNWLLVLLLRIIVKGDLSLHYWTLFNDNSWLHDWIDLSLDHAFTVVEENDFSQLKTLCAVLVVEIKLDPLRISVDFRELDYVPGPHSELELTVRNFVPAALKHVEHMDPDFRRRLARMVARTLKADAFENKFLCKFNLDPGSLMVLDMPLVPFFLTWTEQVLRVASDRMMFSGHTGAFVQMISLKRSSHRHSGCLDHRLLELLLGIIIEGDLRLHNWTLFNDNSWLHDRVYLSLDHAFAVMVEDDLSQL